MKAKASNTQTTTNTQTKRVITPARVVALVLIAVVALGLAYLRFKPGDDQVSVPAGAKAGDLDPEGGHLRHGEGRLPRRHRHAGRAREPPRSRLASDRPAGGPHQGQVRPPGRADLPPRGRPRRDQHAVRSGEPSRRPPRRGPRRLSGRRRLVRARRPRGRGGSEPLPRPPQPGVLPRLRPRSAGRRPATSRGGRRPGRLHDVRAGRRHRGGQDRPPATDASTL